MRRLNRVTAVALDVFIRPAVTGADLAGAVDDPRWQITRGRWRQRVTQLTFEDPDTGVVFTVDDEARELLGRGALGMSSFNGRLNVLRPDFYGRQAVAALSSLVRAAGGHVCLDGASGLVEIDDDVLLEAWRSLNQQGRAAVAGSPRSATPRATRDAVDAWYQWQSGLSARRVEAETLELWLPSIMWFEDGRTGSAMRSVVWTEGQAQAVPDTDVFLYLPELDTGSDNLIVLRRDRALEAIGDLIETRTMADGTVVGFVPLERDEECRDRWVDLGREGEPLRDSGWRRLAPDEVADDL